MQKANTLIQLAILALLVAFGVHYRGANSTPDLTSEYQAIVLTNGQVFFGKLENPTSQFPVLRDVFYIVSQANPETKQVTNSLVRRGGELHGPDYMVINRQSILLIEPVRSDSQVAKSIGEQKSQRN